MSVFFEVLGALSDFRRVKRKIIFSMSVLYASRNFFIDSKTGLIKFKGSSNDTEFLFPLSVEKGLRQVDGDPYLLRSVYFEKSTIQKLDSSDSDKRCLCLLYCEQGTGISVNSDVESFFVVPESKVKSVSLLVSLVECQEKVPFYGSLPFNSAVLAVLHRDGSIIKLSPDTCTSCYTFDGENLKYNGDEIFR